MLAEQDQDILDIHSSWVWNFDRYDLQFDAGLYCVETSYAMAEEGEYLWVDVYWIDVSCS